MVLTAIINEEENKLLEDTGNFTASIMDQHAHSVEFSI